MLSRSSDDTLSSQRTRLECATDNAHTRAHIAPGVPTERDVRGPVRIAVRVVHGLKRRPCRRLNAANSRKADETRMSGDQQQLTVPAMQKLSRDLTQNATKCQDISQFLRSPLAAMFWQSQAANTFKEDTESYVKMLNGFREGFTSLSKEIDSRVGELQGSRNV
jgi:uncharacterized protein YukE